MMMMMMNNTGYLRKNTIVSRLTLATGNKKSTTVYSITLVTEEHNNFKIYILNHFMMTTMMMNNTDYRLRHAFASRLQF